VANSRQRCRWLCVGGADGGRSAAVLYGALDLELADMKQEDINMSKLTRDQAAIIGLYTGVSAGPFEDLQKLAEDLLERPVFTHELANQDLCEKLKELVKPQFIQICAEKNT
jgi:hypothetical protein